MSTKPPAPSNKVELDVKFGRSLSDAGQHDEALRYFAAMLQNSRERADVYEGATAALIGALNEDRVLDQWEARERDQFYAALILQEHCQVSPPILHHRIAAQHTSGVAAFMGRITTKLRKVIFRLLNEHRINKNWVLLVLLLREFLGGELSQAKISRLHISWFDKFTLNDLAIPYNCMFDSVTFKRNQDDIISYLNTEKLPTIERLCLYHILFFEWLAQQSPAAVKSDWPIKVVASRLKQSSLALEDITAAKSIILRHWDASEPLNSLSLEGLGLDEEFIHLAKETSKIRLQLHAQPAPRKTKLGVRLFDNRAWQALRVGKNVIGIYLPFVARRYRRLKIAICVSGQLRGYASAFQSWRRTLLNHIDYELFIHSWQTLGRSDAQPFRYVLPFEGERFTEKYRLGCLKIGLDEFKIRYPTLIGALAETGRVSEDELSEFYGTAHVRLDDDTEPPFVALSNQEKMHSKIEACFEMAMAKGDDYDLIIRLRPDKPIKYLGYDWADIRERCRANPIVLADTLGGVFYGNLMIGDQFAIGAAEPMRIYSTTWSRYPRFVSSDLCKFPSNLEGHVSLAQICWLHGITVKKVPIRFGDLAEPERLSAVRILKCLEKDATGRMDLLDRTLLEAIAADLCL